jgi:hypothetical protein
MLNTPFAPAADGDAYDLPRTFRRERERQERDARTRAQAHASAMAAYGRGGATRQPHADGPVQARVTRLQIPFLRLMLFFVKAAFAAIPALILLGGLVWSAGHLLQLYFPQLVKMQILIQFPN